MLRPYCYQPLDNSRHFRYNADMDTDVPSAIVPDDLNITHDGYFQETFRLKQIAQAFLGKVLSSETIDCLNLEDLVVENRHLADDMFKEAIADVIYRVPIKGMEGYVNFFVVVEHKSFQDYQTIFQLWGYVYRICLREFQAAEKRGDVKVDYRLPPVVAIILHHGESKFRGTTELLELFCSLPGLENYLPRLQAILFDLGDIADDDPILNDPAVPELKVVLMVLKSVFRRDVSLTIQEVLQELKPYSDEPKMRRLIRATWIYLTGNAEYLRQNIEPLLGTFEEVVGEKVMPTMVEIWKAEGKAEGKAETLLAVLRAKFDRIPEEIEDAVRQMSDPIALDSWAIQAATCQSLDEFVQAFR